MGTFRFLLAISVAIFHGADFYGYKFVHGFHAVTIFFIISGFYMTMVLNGKYGSYGHFIVNRLLKLFPIYWLVLILCHLSSPLTLKPLPLPARLYYVFSNIFVLFSNFTDIIVLGPGHATLSVAQFSPSAPRANGYDLLYIGPIWSLSVELIFYFLAPFIVKFDGKYLSRLWILFLLSVSCCVALNLLGAPEVPWQYNFFLPNLQYFLLGSLSYYLYEKRMFQKLVPDHWRVGWPLFLAVVAICVFYPEIPDRLSVGIMGLVVPKVACFAVFSFFCIPYVFSLTKNWKIDRFVGDLSYPIYISHFLFLRYDRLHLPVKPIYLILLFSVLVHFAVARPIEKHLRSKLSSRLRGARRPDSPRGQLSQAVT